MATSPKTQSPLILEGQAGGELKYNEAVVRLECVAIGRVEASQSAPPGSPGNGDAYIVGAAPTGAWTGKADYIAVYYESTWMFIQPTEGFWVYNVNSSAYAVYRSGAWGSAIAAQTSLTDSTGGAVSNTLASITAGAIYAQADMVACKNAIASLGEQINTLMASMRLSGLLKT